jgi:exopolyphosphatase/pppGpp-phosphohydrolase
LQEGAYGYFGARQLLGEKLNTSHVLDIGGGSLQVAGERSSYGEALGQKIWQRSLCQEIRNAESTPCNLQPLTGEELAIARNLLQEKLDGISFALPEPVTMTAISRPVSRGVLPAVRRLAGAAAQPNQFPPNQLQRSAISTAIQQIAVLSREETATLLGSPSAYVAYLLSDMLLVEGLLLATGGETLQVTELDLTNLPGLLNDDQAFTWGRRYDCYLQRLQTIGLAAYGSEPATCP